MQNDVWTVHHTYHVEMTYPGDVRLILDNEFPNGIRFEGTDGWGFVNRSEIDAEPKSLLTSLIGRDELHLYRSDNHWGGD